MESRLANGTLSPSHPLIRPCAIRRQRSRLLPADAAVAHAHRAVQSAFSAFLSRLTPRAPLLLLSSTLRAAGLCGTSLMLTPDRNIRSLSHLFLQISSPSTRQRRPPIPPWPQQPSLSLQRDFGKRQHVSSSHGSAHTSKTHRPSIEAATLALPPHPDDDPCRHSVTPMHHSTPAASLPNPMVSKCVPSIYSCSRLPYVVFLLFLPLFTNIVVRLPTCRAVAPRCVVFVCA